MNREDMKQYMIAEHGWKEIDFTKLSEEDWLFYERQYAKRSKFEAALVNLSTEQ
jgi:hypothetical protein